MSEATEFRRISNGRTLLVVEASLEEDVRALALTAPGALNRLLRASPGPPGRGATAILSLKPGGERLHLRPLHHGGWLAGLWGSRFRSPDRPLAELAATAELRSRGAPVPRPALMLAERSAGFWRAALATVFEENVRDAASFLRAGPDPASVWSAARRAGDAIRRFHDAGGRHPDLHLGNLLVRSADTGFGVLVADLDRAEVGDGPPPARRMRELMRLYRSLRKHDLLERVGQRGCAAFLSGYARSDRTLRKALLEHAPRERVRVAIHALAYRTSWTLRSSDQG